MTTTTRWTPMLRRYFAGLITGSGDLLGRRRVVAEAWWEPAAK